MELRTDGACRIMVNDDDADDVIHSIKSESFFVWNTKASISNPQMNRVICSLVLSVMHAASSASCKPHLMMCIRKQLLSCGTTVAKYDNIVIIFTKLL